jgi:type IV secretion system protein VirD4
MAWPQPARGALPGAVGVYLAATLSAALLAAATVGLHRLAEAARLPSLWRRRERPPAASWATARDLRLLRVRGPQAGRLTLGRFGRSLLAAEQGHSVIVFGPTQTHKTSGLAIPALLEWKGPVLCTSVKSDVLAVTHQRREALGEVWVFDPAQVVDAERARATPLRSATSWEGAVRVAHWLSSSARSGGREMHDANFWFANAEKLLGPLLFAAASSLQTMETVVRWLDEGPEAIEGEVLGILADAPPARRAFLATQNREERQRSSVYTTAETIVAAFADPRVAEETCGADYTPEALLGGANTLYLVSPEREQERLRTVFSTLIEELLALVDARAIAGSGPINPRLLLLLDECANVAPLPGLDGIASTAAGKGVQLLTVFQDLAQVQAQFGTRAPTIVNNHPVKLIGTGVSDRETLSYLDSLIGAGEFEQRSVQSGERGRRSETEGDTYQQLAPGHFVRQRPPGTAIAVASHLLPALIDLRPWYRDRSLRELQHGTVTSP